MGRYDYDDMPERNSSRGHKGNRRTALATAFFILVALIVLVIYLIANPADSTPSDVSEGSVTVVEEKTAQKDGTPSSKEEKGKKSQVLIPLIAEDSSSVAESARPE